MDWKEIQNRLNGLSESPLIVSSARTLNSTTSFKPKEMSEVYELVKNGEMFLTEAYKQVTGKKTNGDLIKRWFDNRGWVLNYIKGQRDDNFYKMVQKDINNDMTEQDICKKYGITSDNLESYFTRKKLVKKNKRGVKKRQIIQMLKDGKTNKEIYSVVGKGCSASVSKLRKQLGIPLVR